MRVGGARVRVRQIGVVLAIMTALRVAHADDATAREHFRRAVVFYDQKQFEVALDSFRRAYAEKPSAAIKQNIALCLKGLGRRIEAAAAFDEALEEGEGTLSPAVRAAIEKELVELPKTMATVRFRFVSPPPDAATHDVTVKVDDAPLASGSLRRPLRLEPGIHTFAAHSNRFLEPPTKKLSLLAGEPVDVTFEFEEPVGALTIAPNIPSAVVRVDGVVVQASAWPLRLPAGPHLVVLSAPGYKETTIRAVVSAGAAVEYPIVLPRIEDVPPEYDSRAPRSSASKKRYVAGGFTYVEQNLRLAPVLGERVGGSKRTFKGITLGVRGGYQLSKNFSLELLGEIGELRATYSIGAEATSTKTRVRLLQIAPMLRFSTDGHVRFTTSTGFGIHGLIVTTDASEDSVNSGRAKTIEGRGASLSWLADMGIQFDAGPIFLEVVGGAVVHGVGTARDEDTNLRMILSSPSTRALGRLGIGFFF